MLETIEEEREAEKTMDFGSETKKVRDENRKDDQKMLNIASNRNNVGGLEAVENFPKEIESDKKEVVDSVTLSLIFRQIKAKTYGNLYHMFIMINFV